MTRKKHHGLTFQLAALHRKSIGTGDPSYLLSEVSLAKFYGLALVSRKAKLAIRTGDKGIPIAFACGFVNLEKFHQRLAIWLIVDVIRNPKLTWKLLESLQISRRTGNSRRNSVRKVGHLGMIVADSEVREKSLVQLLDCIGEIQRWLTDEGVNLITATTREDNGPALSLLKGLGFKPTSEVRGVVALEKEIPTGSSV